MIQQIISRIKRIDPKKLKTGIIGSTVFLMFVKVVIVLKKCINSYLVNSAYKKQALKYIKERNDNLLKFLNENSSKVSLEDQKIIYSSDLLQLKDYFINGKYSSEQITLSLLIRAIEVGLVNNYLADVNLEETMRLAHEADAFYLKNKQNQEELNKLPLLGLPLSIKECIPTEKFRTTLGYAVNIQRPANQHDCYLIEVLKRKGAVPLLTTNVPQGLLAIESENLIYGKTLNPFDKDRTSGGSTGGEAGLIRLLGSAAGIGSDIGGSIRIPASFCGIYGFKPTAMRMSRIGAIDLDSTIKRGGHSSVVNSTMGPMARSLSDIVFLMKNILGEFPNDLYILNKKFSEKRYQAFQDKNRRLKIGYWFDTELMKTAAPIKDKMNLVVNTLKDLKKTGGYQIDIEEFPYKKFNELFLLSAKMFSSLGNLDRIVKAIKGEFTMPFYSNLIKLMSIPNYIRKTLAGLFGLLGRSREKDLITWSNGKITLNEFFEELTKLNYLKNEFYQMFQELKFDAIISPVTPFLAPHHGDSKDLVPFVHFSILINILDLPAGVIPIGKAGKIEPYTDTYNDKFTKLINKNLKNGEHLPIGIQIATLTHQDEACLAIMKVVDDILINNKIVEKC